MRQPLQEVAWKYCRGWLLLDTMSCIPFDIAFNNAFSRLQCTALLCSALLLRP
jgi:hypothetical protein